MPVRQTTKPPAIDFDLDGVYAPLHMLGTMCWLDPNVLNSRLAKFGLNAIEIAKTTRAVQRWRMISTESARPQLRHEVKRLERNGIPESTNV